MTDLFDSVAAQALGLGRTLQSRARSRYEHDANVLESDAPWPDAVGYMDAVAATSAAAEVVVPPVAVPGAHSMGARTAEPRLAPGGVQTLGQLQVASIPRGSSPSDTPPPAASTDASVSDVRGPDLSQRREEDHLGEPLQGRMPRFPSPGQTARASMRSDPTPVGAAPSDTRPGRAEDRDQSERILTPPRQSLKETA
jgi:hypothetical protein